MPFQKGRAKTGGRVKGGPVKRSSLLVDRLKDYKFNYVKALADALSSLPTVVDDVPKYRAWRRQYDELKDLLPYMAPKMREKEVALFEREAVPVQDEASVTDEALLKAMEEKNEPHPRPSNPAPVEKGNPGVQAAPGPADDLQNVAGEQEPD